MGDSSYHLSNNPLPILSRYLSIVYIVRRTFDFLSFSQSPLKHSSSCLVLFGYQVHGLLEPFGIRSTASGFPLCLRTLLVFSSFICALGIPWLFSLSILPVFCEAVHRTFYHFDLYSGTRLKVELFSEAFSLLLYSLTQSRESLICFPSI